MNKTEKPATLKDVAALAGVSVMTVSNAINRKGGLSEKTYEKVMEAIRQLNYAPNTAAKTLKNSKTNTIGVIMADASYYVFSSVLRGITDEAAKRNYKILLTDTSQDASKEEETINLLANNNVDGMIIVAPHEFKRKYSARLKELAIPFVVLMRSVSKLNAEYVVNDNYAGAYQLMEHVYSSGERNFCFLSIDSPSGEMRVKGYRDYLRDVHADNVTVMQETVLPQIEEGHAVMLDMIRNGCKSGCVLCGCDLIAIGAMDAIYESGYQIPRDFRIAGYDDLEMSRYLKVPLTTVRQPLESIGRESVMLLHNRIEHPDTPFQSRVLQPELVIRQSTKKEE